METAWWGPGPEAAPTILMLHEGLGCVALWRDIPARLAAATGCGVMAYSRLGYGQSDPVRLPRPLTYLQVEAREVLPRVLDAAGLRRVLLLGHSDGGSIAAIHAGSLQDARVQGLVLIAPHFFVEPVGIDAIRGIAGRWRDGDLRARLARHHRDVEIAFRGWHDAWLDPGFPAVLDLQPELAHIRVPVLILQGEDDAYGTDAQPRLAERECYCPVETRMLPGAGHSPHLDQPEAVVGAVAAFAGRLWPGPGPRQAL